LGWPLDVEEVLAAWFDADFRPKGDVVAAATGWGERGARVVLVTNQEHRRAAYLQTRLADLLPFDAMVYSAALGCTKAVPEFFVAAAKRLEIDDVGSVVFLDDDAHHVEVARSAEWSAVHFTGTSSLHVVGHLLEQTAAGRTDVAGG
jgi:putative hydrolase of the HAD superfamily